MKRLFGLLLLCSSLFAGETIIRNGTQVVEKDGIAAVSTDGIAVVNNTPATVGTTVQYSPRIRQRGSAWDTDGAVSDTWDWWWEVVPLNGNTTTAMYKLFQSKAGAAGTSILTITQAGVITAVPALSQFSASIFTAGGQGLTAGTMTTDVAARLSPCWSRISWTNAMITALGAVSSGDIVVCTLPAKTRVMQALVVITGQGVLAGATLTGQVGTDATFSNYIAAGDLKAAANVVYGDANAECGASLPGGGLYVGHLPSWTATTVVKMRVTTDGGGGATLAGVTGSTGYVYLLTEVLP